MSQPNVSHQVETNVVTQALSPTCAFAAESDPAAPPRAAADDRQKLSPRTRFSRLGPPTAGRIVGGGSLVLATHGSSVPGTGQRPRDGPSSSRDRTRRARRAGHGQNVRTSVVSSFSAPAKRVATKAVSGLSRQVPRLTRRRGSEASTNSRLSMAPSGAAPSQAPEATSPETGEENEETRQTTCDYIENIAYNLLNLHITSP